MRTSNLSQPHGTEILSDLLTEVENTLSITEFAGSYNFSFSVGCVYKDLHRYSYNLTLVHKGVPMMIVYYELDKRFSLELSGAETDRIENLLANEAIVQIAMYGLIGLIRLSRAGHIYTVVRKESDDKKFLPLN